jgi:hypothetical protein
MSVTILKQQGTSGRTAPGFSYYSGMMFYGAAPSTWGTVTHPLFPSVAVYVNEIVSYQDAIAKGILKNTDNTAASGSIAWGTGSSLGTLAAGDVITVTDDIPINGQGTSSFNQTQTVTLCSYTCVAGDISDTTGAALATHITAAINALTWSTGFSSTRATNVSTIIAPKSIGKGLNTSSPVITITNSHTMTNTIVAFSGGTASLFAAVDYHISEYFRKNPTGILFIGFISTSSSFQEMLALQLYSGNQLRWLGLFDTSSTRGLAANLLATVQSVNSIAALQSGINPFEVIYQPNIFAVSDLSTMPNGQLNTTGTNTQVIISQDGNAAGNLLFTCSGYSIGNLGAKLGTASATRISASDAQPTTANNVSNGIENNQPAFANGQLLSSVSASLNQQLFGGTITNVSGYCYTGFRNFPGRVSGTYWTGNAMFTNSASSYAFMNDNQVWDEITRVLQAAYTPYDSAEWTFNSDGTISDASVNSIEDIGTDAIVAALITPYNPPLVSVPPTVTVDPTQPLKQTGNLQIQVTNTENGISRNITITSGLN